MSLTRPEVEHVARLAHLAMDESEIEKLCAQLSQILDYFELLSRVDTEGVPPTAHTLPLENVARDDEARPSSSREDMMANAPLRAGDFFRVRKVLE